MRSEIKPTALIYDDVNEDGTLINVPTAIIS